MERLYLVAALTDLGIERRVWDYKEDIARKYGSVRGLKVLPHITEINPFKRSEEDEHLIIDQLGRLISSFAPLELRFNGFGYFENSRSNTIYIKVENENDVLLQEQHKQLNIYAREKLGLAPEYAPLKFTPHMTIAYRDLDQQKFNYAWPDYSNKKFEEKMMLESLWLLKHDGLCWVPYQEFAFKGFKNTLFE